MGTTTNGRKGQQLRNTLIDNTKGVLIFLVVLGHYLEKSNGWSNQYLSAILSFIYLFHMPAFVFLAGITAKPNQLGMRIANITIILIVFQLAYLTPIILINGTAPVGLLQPYWILWFLLSLIWWMILTPVIVKFPGALAFSVIISIAGGFLPGDGQQLSIMRTLTFLPFFVGGHLYGNRIVAYLDANMSRRFLAIATLAVTGTISYTLIVIHGFGPYWLYGSYSYVRLGVDDAAGVLLKTSLLALSSASLVAFMYCLTRKTGPLTIVGQNSLSIFVLHGFAVIVAGEILELTGLPPTLWIVVFAVIAAFVTTIFLAHPVFDKAIRRLAGKISAYAKRK